MSLYDSSSEDEVFSDSDQNENLADSQCQLLLKKCHELVQDKKSLSNQLQKLDSEKKKTENSLDHLSIQYNSQLKHAQEEIKDLTSRNKQHLDNLATSANIYHSFLSKEEQYTQLQIQIAKLSQENEIYKEKDRIQQNTIKNNNLQNDQLIEKTLEVEHLQKLQQALQFQISQLTNQVKELSDRSSHLQNLNEQQEKEKQQLIQQILRFSERKMIENMMDNELQGIKDKSETEMNILRHNRNLVLEENKKLEFQLTNLQKKFDDLQLEYQNIHNTYTSQIIELERDNKTQIHKNDDLMISNQRLSQDIQQCINKNDQLFQKNQILSEEYFNLDTEFQQYKVYTNQEIQQLQNSVSNDNHEKNHEKDKIEIKKLQTEIQELQSLLSSNHNPNYTNSPQTNLSGLLEEISHLKQQASKDSQTIYHFQKENQHLKEYNQQCQSNLTMLSKELSILQEKSQTWQTLKNELTKQFNEKRHNNLYQNIYQSQSQSLQLIPHKETQSQNISYQKENLSINNTLPFISSQSQTISQTPQWLSKLLHSNSSN